MTYRDRQITANAKRRDVAIRLSDGSVKVASFVQVDGAAGPVWVRA